MQNHYPKLLGRYSRFPLQMYRIQSSQKAKLRPFDEQKKLGRTSFDLKIRDDDLVHPRPIDHFLGIYIT